MFWMMVWEEVEEEEEFAKCCEKLPTKLACDISLQMARGRWRAM
jgi:hypothetical protein